MKILKSFEKYSDKNINENVKDMLGNFTNFITYIFDFLHKKFQDKATSYYAIYLSKKNRLPKDSKGRNKVLIRVPEEWYNDKIYDEIDEELGKNDITLPDQIKENMYYDINDLLDEGIVPLSVPPDSDILNVSIPTLKKFIHAKYKERLNAESGRFGDDSTEDRGGPLFIWGAPGIGKTDITHQLAKELDIQIQVWTLSTLDPTDLKGVPFIVKIMDALFPKRTQNAIPSVLPKSNWNGRNDKGGILFLDEFNRAIPPVHNACLSLIANGRIDRYKLPSKWFIVVAGNKLSDLANLAGTEMSAEMQNRFMHINLVPTVDDWSKHFTKDGKVVPKMNPDLIEFLSFMKDYFHRMSDDPEVLTKSPAFATPRKWADASKNHYYEVDGDWNNKLSYNDLVRIYTKSVGREAAIVFAGYVDMKNNYDVNDIKDILENGSKAKRDLPKRLEQKWGAIMAITSYVKNDNREITPKELANLYDFGIYRMQDDELAESFLSYIKTNYPYIEDPKYPELVKIRWDYIKIWNQKLKEKNIKYNIK